MGRITGMYVGGVVQERQRRYIDRENGDRVEIVTYTIVDDNDKRYFLEDYSPTSYREKGNLVLEPVYVKPYKKKNGDLSYTICIKKDFEGGRGESF